MKWVPVWFPVAVAVATVLVNAGATYASLGEAERRIEAVEKDRAEKVREYEQFRTEMRSDVAEIKADLRWIRSAVSRR